MKLFYLVLGWMFGVIFFFAGMFLSFKVSFAGLCLIFASALLLPPTRTFTHSLTKISLSSNVRALLIFALLIGSVVFMMEAEEKKKEELAAKQASENTARLAQIQKEVREETISYFHANREQIVASINRFISQKDFQSAITQSDKYLISGDKDVESLNLKAKSEYAAIQKAEKTERLLAELKTIPVSQYEENRRRYQQLLDMHPGNKFYKDKVDFYIKEIEKEKQKQAVLQARKKSIESQFSSWDGSHINLTRAIKNSMHDPKSYKHVETVYWDRGDHLVVRTTFRGKNAFGGLVRNSVRAKVALDGTVLLFLD